MALAFRSPFTNIFALCLLFVGSGVVNKILLLKAGANSKSSACLFFRQKNTTAVVNVIVVHLWLLSRLHCASVEIT